MAKGSLTPTVPHPAVLPTTARGQTEGNAPAPECCQGTAMATTSAERCAMLTRLPQAPLWSQREGSLHFWKPGQGTTTATRRRA